MNGSNPPAVVEDVPEPEVPHVGHHSRLGGLWFCDTCNSPYCDLA